MSVEIIPSSDTAIYEIAAEFISVNDTPCVTACCFLDCA